MDQFKEIAHVKMHLISQKDICPFCRASLSFLLSPVAGKPEARDPRKCVDHVWFNIHMQDLLKELEAAVREVKESEEDLEGSLEETEKRKSFSIELYASSIEFADAGVQRPASIECIDAAV